LIHSKPYVLLGPTYSGKTSLLIQLTCALSKLEKELRTPVLTANFPGGPYRSAKDSCLTAKPSRTIQTDYVTLYRNVGDISWLAPSGLPEEGVARSDFIDALEMGPSVLGFVFDLGIGFIADSTDPINATIKINTHFYEMLLRVIKEEEARLIPFLKHPRKMFFFNKIDIPLANNLSPSDALNIARKISTDVEAVSKKLIGFNILEGIQFKMDYITYALKNGEVDQSLVKYRINAFKNLIEPVVNRLSETARQFLVSFLKSLSASEMVLEDEYYSTPV